MLTTASIFPLAPLYLDTIGSKTSSKRSCNDLKACCIFSGSWLSGSRDIFDEYGLLGAGELRATGVVWRQSSKHGRFAVLGIGGYGASVLLVHRLCL